MKKTWLSYPLWLIFTVMTGMLFIFYLPAIGGNAGRNHTYTVALFVFALLAAAGIWLLGYKVAGALQGSFLKDAHSRKMAECFLVMCLAAAAILYRIHLLKFWDGLENRIFYDMAAVKDSGGVPEIAHGASYVYTCVLSIWLSFSGNKEIAGAALQLLLQISSLLLAYFGIRLLAGRVEALGVMAVMAFWPVYAGQIYCLTPDAFYFFLFAAGILCIGLCGKTIGTRKKSAYAAFWLAGAYTGILGYLDVSGTLLFLPAGVLCVREGMQGKGGRRAGWLKFLSFLMGAGIALCGLMVLDAALTGSSLGDIWNAWRAVFGSRGSWRVPAGPDGDGLAGLALGFCSALGIYGFWAHGNQKQDGWILYLLAITFLDMVTVGPLEYQMFIALGWGVLAGIGITSAGIYPDEGEKRKTPLPELELVDMDELEEEQKPEEEEGRPKVKFIENPLPLPKKHIRREMDFDKLVEWDKMKYDVEVDETDDFDI